MSVAVVGSGPSGWAAAQRLVELGISVDMFSSDVAFSEDSVDTSIPKGVKLNRKLLHGLDYPYRSFPAGPRIFQDNVAVTTSFAQSGLSLVWGATMLPYQYEDVHNWCVTSDELDIGYKWITSRVPIAGRLDQLAHDFTPYLSQPPLLPTSRILRFLEKTSKSIETDCVIGSSRLAVYSVPQQKQNCVYCKRCLSGCPFDAIWKTPKVFGLHKYFGGVRVLSINQSKNKNMLQTVSINGDISWHGNYERVFICAGPVESFRILATSKYVSTRTVISDSQTFFVPILLNCEYGKPDEEAHALSQAFCHLKEDSKTKSQLQIYDYSDDFISRAYQAIPMSRLFPQWLLKIPLQRLFVGIGYLNDEDSARISMQLNKSGDVELSLEDQSGEFIKRNVRTSVNMYKRNLYRYGLIPIKSLTQIALPGQGVHYGAWLSMGKSSDRFGQPNNLKGVHVLDSSILPSIPAGPITFTVMANAIRIIEELYG